MSFLGFDWARAGVRTLPSLRTAPRQRAPNRRATRKPQVLRSFPRLHPATLAALSPARRYRFTDIGQVGYAKGAHGEDTSQVRTIDAVLAKVPIIGGPAATVVKAITDIGQTVADLIAAGNAAGLSPQQLDAISAGIKRYGAGSTGSVLASVEGRAGTKQILDPDGPPGTYRTVGGRIRDGV